jgi:hypothetical protein
MQKKKKKKKKKKKEEEEEEEKTMKKKTMMMIRLYLTIPRFSPVDGDAGRLRNVMLLKCRTLYQAMVEV